jgi:hypothetical protein
MIQNPLKKHEFYGFFHISPVAQNLILIIWNDDGGRIMNRIKRIITGLGIISALMFTSCGLNPFDLSLLTNNAFANIMVAFLRNLGVPVGMDKRQEGNQPAEQLAKASARSLSKVAAGEQFGTISVEDAEDSLKAWFSAEFVDANKSTLLQPGDSILFAPMENDTDNYEVKNGHVIVNLGPSPVNLLDQENFRFWAFKGHNRKIQVNGKGDKVGEEGDVTGLVFIPSKDRRMIWRGVATKAMDGIDDTHREYNVGDSASAEIDSLIREGGDWVQYGKVNYWDESEQRETMGIEIKIYHNNTVGLEEYNWADNKAETHFPLIDETSPTGDKKEFYIVATHYGEDNPSADNPHEFREEGNVYRNRSCSNPDVSEEECSLKNGYNYSDKHISYEKERGNCTGTIIFYDEDGEEIDRRTEDQCEGTGDSQTN